MESAEELNQATEEARDKLTAAKTRLFEVYDMLLEEELTEKISKVEVAGDGRQHGEAWNQENKISGRKKSKAGQIGGLTSEDHIHTWYTHFKNILGNPQIFWRKMKISLPSSQALT